jgi:hypothetical protein
MQLETAAEEAQAQAAADAADAGDAAEGGPDREAAGAGGVDTGAAERLAAASLQVHSPHTPSFETFNCMWQLATCGTC